MSKVNRQSSPESNTVHVNLTKPILKQTRSSSKEEHSINGLVSKERIAPHRKVIQDAALLQLRGLKPESRPDEVALTVKTGVDGSYVHPEDDYESSKVNNKKVSRSCPDIDVDSQAVRDLDYWTPNS